MHVCQPRPDSGLGQRFYICLFAHACLHECVCACVTNGWGPLVELEGLLWVKRMTEKEIRQRKEMERDRRATTSSKCNYMAQNHRSALGQADMHTHACGLALVLEHQGRQKSGDFVQKGEIIVCCEVSPGIKSGQMYG